MRNGIIIIKKPTGAVRKDVNRLIGSLSLTATSPRPLSVAQFRDLIAQKNVFLLAVVLKEGLEWQMIGFLTLYLVRIPSGIVGVTEDLLVDERYRKWGIGRALMEHAILLAEKKGARHLSLRTNPIRIEANKLYEQMGFHLMTTNFYRMNLPRKK